MPIICLVRSLFRRRVRRPRQSVRYRPEVTALESRWLPSTITEFPLPPVALSAGYAAPITGGPDGNLWFTDPELGKIARITPAGQVTEFTLPYGGGNAITAGADGNLWVAAGPFTPAISRVTPTGQVDTFFLGGGTLGSVPSLAAGPDGNVWFTHNLYPSGETVGRITPTGQVTEFSIPSPSGFGGIGSITTGPDGNLWFTHDFTLATITPNGALRDHVADNVNGALTTGPDGNLWASGPLHDPLTGRLGGDVIQRVSLTGTVTTFNVGTTSVSLSAITAGPDGNLWFTEPDDNEIGRITPAGQITLFPVPTPGSQPTGIAVGSNGNLWFAEVASRHIGEYFLTGTPPVPAAATTTALTVDVSAPLVGQTVHLTATVTSPAGTPAGTVTFIDGHTPLGTVSLDSSGHATLDTIFVLAGGHNLTAVFNGTPAFAPSISPAVWVAVSLGATTTTGLAIDVSSPSVGQPVHLTATVTSPAGTPAGTVTFFDGATALGTISLNTSGQAVLATKFRTAGSHSLTAVFNGTPAFASSESPAVAVTVRRVSTKTTLTASANPAALGQTLVLTAAVTPAFPGAGVPTGRVVLRDGNTTIASATLDSSGRAVFTLIPGTVILRNGSPFTVLPRGTHQLTASWTGNANFAASVSAILDLIVT